MPQRASSRRYPVEVSAVAWLDLLGYGSMLRPIRFDPSHDNAQEAVRRLQQFQREAAKSATRHIHAMIVNDGVAYVRELSPRTRSVTYDFLYRVFNAYTTVNQADAKEGHAGARMVVAVGPRLRMDGVNRARPGYLQNILERLQIGTISAVQAVREAFRSQPITGSVPTLQANFAFTKAYLADRDGRASGFAGPNCFVDSLLFTSPPPAWLAISKSIDWATEGISGRFYQLTSIDNIAAGAVQHSGTHDALQIAESLNLKY